METVAPISAVRAKKSKALLRAPDGGDRKIATVYWVRAIMTRLGQRMTLNKVPGAGRLISPRGVKA